MSAADIGACEWSDILPKRELAGWVIVDPDGRVEGVRLFGPGTAEEAHRKFTPRKRDRGKEIRDGWTVRREQPGDRESLMANFEEVPS